MNVAEIKLNLFRNIHNLPEQLLLELRAMIDEFLAKKRQPVAPVPPKLPRKFGCLKGTVVYMAPDFDEPLEDFKEYMP